MSSLAHEQVNFCHLPVQLSSVNTQYNPPPISSGRNVASVKIFEQKKVCLPADSYGRVSPKQSPRCSTDSSVCRHDPLPCFELSLCARRGPNLGLFEVALASRKRKGECQDFIWHSAPWTTCHLLTGSVDIATKNRSDMGRAALNLKLYRSSITVLRL